MKKLKCSSLLVVLALAAGMLLSAGNNSSEAKNSEKKVIRIGASPEAIPLAKSGVASLEAMGYKVEVVPFDDFFVPNVALNEGSIDANFYQHKPFLDNYNRKNGTNIVMLIPPYNYSNNIYSKKASSLKDIPKGNKFGIANDASNIDKNLRLLQKAGLITLTKEKKDLYTIVDVIDNPKNLTFVQLDYKQRIAALDELGGIVCGSNNVFMAGLNPMENVLYKEVDNNYALGPCINGNTSSKNDQWVKDLMSAYTSNKAYKYVQDHYRGAYTRSKQFEAIVTGKKQGQ
jgi:D-methionine transport system substrate-binding protein